jgi:hypothetical protein
MEEPSAEASDEELRSMLTVMRTELLAVRRDRKGLLDELVDLTESYDSVVRVTEEQVGTVSLVIP